MRARSGRRLFLAALTLVGAGLVATAYLLQLQESRRRSAPAPEPDWRSADRSADFLRGQLRPLVAIDSTALPQVLARLKSCDFLTPSSDRVHMRMTRVLNSGHEFEAEIFMARHPSSTGQEFEFSVTRANREPLQLRMEVRGGAIAGVQQTSGTTAPSWQPWEGATNLPVALGDLPMDEALQLCQAFDSGALEPAGCLEGKGSRPQLVLEANLGKSRGAEPSGGISKAPDAAERALVYVDSETHHVRSVRVLDAKGYVVRVYDDLVWEMAGPRAQLVALRITSMPAGSHTVFRRISSEHQ